MAGESIAVAIYKLGMENQQYIAATKAAAQAGDQLVAAQERIVTSEQKVGAASTLAANAVQRKVEANDKSIQAARKYAEAVAFVARAEEQNVGSAQMRQTLLDQEAEKLRRTTDALAAKAKAERDAAQAAKDAEAAAKNLARLESEHATALQNVATALGVDRAALIASANAGNRHAAATLDMMNKIVGLNKELQAGNLRLADHAKEVDRVQQGYRSSVTAIATQEAAMRKSNTVTGLARHELINLSRQFQDIGVSLAGGQSPFRILIEQGSQIVDVFASSRAVFADVFRNVVAWAARAATSIIGVATALAAIGLAAGAAAVRWIDAQREIEKSFVGLGRGAGVTTAEVTKFAENAAKTTRLSTAQAREAAIAFINTGKIYKENLEGAIELVDKYALATGTTVAEAQKELAKQLSGGIQGVIELNNRFGFLNASELENIRTLYARRKEQEAIQLTIQKLLPVLKAGADLSSEWARGWMATTKVFSEFVDMIGKAVAEYAVLQRMRAADIGPSQERRGVGGRAFAQARPSDVASTQGAGLAADEAQRSILSLAAANVTLGTSTEQATVALTAQEERLRILGLESVAYTETVFPQIDAIRKLTEQLETLQKTQAGGAAAGLSTTQSKNLQDAVNQINLLKMRQEDSLKTTKQQNAAVLEVVESQRLLNGLINEETGERERLTVETSLQLNALDKQIAVYTARNRAGVEAAVNEQKINELVLQGKSHYEAQLIVQKQQLLVHLQNMTTLKEQLSVAVARTGIAKINAQYEVDINTRLREGATLSQAIAEATIKRKIAIENVNTAITEQIHGLNQQIELIQARRSGDEASVIAAQAYENAIRQGADATHAAALEAKVLELEIEKAADAGARAAQAFVQMGRSLRDAGTIAADVNQLAAKLASIGTGGAKGISGIQGFDRPGSVVHTQLGGGGPLVGAAGASTAYNVDIYRGRDPVAFAKEAAEKMAVAQEKAAQAAEEAARAQEEAARAAQDAAEAMERAAKELAEAQKEWFSEVVANYLIRGFDPRVINAAIEAGQLNVGDASTRFQTQLDLYKRAGLSNAQILADIRAGIIGEDVKPTELLAAIDSLTGAVESNTAAQLGLSEFYTQQGDRLLGYRGYNVQRAQIPFTQPNTGVGGVGGTLPPPGGILPPPGSIPLPPPYIPPPTGVGGTGGPVSGPQPLIRILNGRYVEGYYDANGQWITTRVIGSAPGIAMPPNTVGVPAGSITTAPYSSFTSSNLSGLYGQPTTGTRFAEGGIADRPTLGMFGEGGPEAFVPLKGGAIPVRLVNAANQNRPTNVVNINAPLINFMAEPTRDEVRQSAFQAAQMLRRVAMG